MKSVTSIAPVNIALIKYWGKRDEEKILPLNDSLSVTLSTNEIYAKTSVYASKEIKENRIWLNGKEESFKNPRLLNCLHEIKKRAKKEGSSDLCDYKVHICSVNNFPTAAGLASSAAGYACLVYALAQLYSFKGDISDLARLGSGSACRSVYGGFVRWYAGCLQDGSDSVAKQVLPHSHWPEIRILVLVVSDRQKSVSSSTGMQRTARTSDLLKHRIDKCVPQRIEEIEKAIKEKNFGKLAEITMKDSNQFHAVALDTYPPCVYMNDTSHRISVLIHAYNTHCGSSKVAYTFDAGPNACLFLEESSVPEVAGLVNIFFPPPLNTETTDYWRGPIVTPPNDVLNIAKQIEAGGVQCQPPGQLKQIIYTSIGDGPRVVTDESLLNDFGFPHHLI